MTATKQKIDRNLLSKTRFVVFIFLVLGFVLYGNTFGNQFLFDDYDQIINNQYVTNFQTGEIFTKNITAGAGLKDNFYRPLVSLSFAIDYKLWGEKPAGFHFTNIILHILSALLIYFIFLKLKASRIVSFLVGLLFLIHPLQIESVTYISGRTDLMPIFLMLLSLYLFLHVFSSEKYKGVLYVLSLLSFLLALFSKELAVVFPFLLFLVYFVFIKREWNRKNIKIITLKLLPFFVLILAYVIFRQNIISLPFGDSYTFSQNFFERCVSFFKVLLIYWGIILFPINIRSRFEKVVEASPFSPEVIISLLILLAIIYFSIRSLKKDRKIFFGFAWFFVCLTPASGIFMPLFSAISEHWLRLPSIGVFFLGSLGIVGFWGKLSKHKRIRVLLIVVFIIYTSYLSIVTIKTNFLWKTPVSYFSYLLKFYPKETRIHTNLAIGYEQQGEREKAFEEYQRAVESDPDFVAAHLNLGGYYAEKRQYNLAIKEYEEAIELDNDFAPAYSLLARVYVNAGQLNEAIRTLEELQKILPNSWKPYSLLGQVYVLKKDYTEAEKYLNKALSLDPENTGLKQRLEALKILNP